ncbi:uncharacterized protein UMAG_11203 [Mycosarcoma maydis]|uniref:AB hydrolase-1 domain-containing protein n=1 Tax=Mycosarcoma maydis TaxID=5270 RepID=A0A0D1CG91_MYCMD|nr:uncharacterized protein UMAG_11203 [Ustilago maydis 521]KIS66008.1 hypothetical protein UMAG_11203 [Ustilago maydis 521]|eukprot:XP_011392484.1 hypothetical protein UMAG_11203 [Ustilago maydis 521]
MPYLPLLPELVSCEPDSSVGLEKVQGARSGLLRWQSAAGSGRVELVMYLDEWLDASTSGTIEQVVVHVHGKERQADAAWVDMATARSRVSRSDRTRTLIVAPRFLNGLDKAAVAKLDSTALLVWKSNGWGEGSPSVHPKQQDGVSSFEALDAIVCHFASRSSYPRLGRVVLSGHSLGGQLVHRYSILGCPPLTWQQRQALVVEYVVMNPASYLYFTPERAGPPAAGMNVYKYGLEDIGTKLSTYRGLPDHRDARFWLHRMLGERRIHFVHGENDRGVGDDRPEAMAQGANRVERACNYHAHLQQLQSMHATQKCLWTANWVPGVKHDGRAVTTSNVAIARIFPFDTA